MGALHTRYAVAPTAPTGEEGGKRGVGGRGTPPYYEPAGTATARARNDKKSGVGTADEGEQEQHGFKVDCACRWGRKKGHGEKGGRGFSPRSRLSEISANGNKDTDCSPLVGGGCFLFLNARLYLSIMQVKLLGSTLHLKRSVENLTRIMI